MTDAFTYSFEQAQQLMQQRDVFDVTKEPAKDLERYGKHDFGRHCLLARRLLENGITFVQVTHSNYDTHNENFDFHIEQLGEFDRSFASFVADLADRGMLDSTLIVVLSEFGRTPNINHYLRPRSLVEGLVGVPGRLPHSARRRLRQDERQRHRGRRRPGRSRRSCSTPTWRRSASIPPASFDHRRPRDADRRSGGRGRLGTAYLTSVPRCHAPPGFDPKQAHVVSQWPHDRPLNACRFDPAGRFVFCGSEDANVERFNLADGARTIFAGGHETWVQAIGFSKDGAQVISGGCDGKLTWWDTAAEAPKPIRSIEAHKGWIRSLDVSPDGTLLASGGNDNQVRLWNMADGTLVRELPGHARNVY